MSKPMSFCCEPLLLPRYEVEVLGLFLKTGPHIGILSHTFNVTYGGCAQRASTSTDVGTAEHERMIAKAATVAVDTIQSKSVVTDPLDANATPRYSSTSPPRRARHSEPTPQRPQAAMTTPLTQAQRHARRGCRRCNSPPRNAPIFQRQHQRRRAQAPMQAPRRFQQSLAWEMKCSRQLTCGRSTAAERTRVMGGARRCCRSRR